jgi:hypothetical protein
MNPFTFSRPLTAIYVLIYGLCSVLLAGCGAGGDPASLAASTISGVVMGGRQPVTSSNVYILASGYNGNNNSSTVIAKANTDASGNFSISAFSPLPSTGDLITIHSVNGNAGSGSNNDTIRLMSVLGVYNSSSGLNFTVNINELSTVAAMFVFQTNLQSTNACNNYVSTSISKNCVTLRGNSNVAWTTKVNQFNGLIAYGNGGFSGSISSTSRDLISIEASVLANCVNSSGGTYASTGTACGNFFSQSQIASTTADTISDAMINVQANTTGATSANQSAWAQKIFNLVPSPAVYPQSTYTSGNLPTTLILN